MGFPNPHHVAKEAERYIPVFGGLVFEKQVNGNRLLSGPRMKQQVAFELAEVGIDKGTGLQTE
jgi:hypothetical protein